MDPNVAREYEDNQDASHFDRISQIVNARMAARAGAGHRRAALSITEPSAPENSNRRRRPRLSSMETLRRAESQLRGVNFPPTGENPSASFPERDDATLSSPPPTERRRVKRRKLETEDTREGIRGFKYGHYGQVVSVPLEMEIASCDPDNRRTHHLAENVLHDDRSVYHPESNRCNIILRHRGDIPFCLKKLVIRTPMTGVDPPSSVREGMVFVSMAMDDVFHRTARYQLRYPDNITGQRGHDQSVRHYFNVIRSLLSSPERTSSRESDDSSQRVSVTSPPANGEQPSDLNVTTEQDDKVEEESLDTDNQRDDFFPSDIEDTDFVQPPEAPSSADTEDSDDSISGVVEALARHLDGSQQRLLESLGVTEPFIRLRSQTFRRMRQSQLPTILSSHGEDTAADPSSSSVMKPHARFYVENEKNMVSIKFDPPASGRFILLKLWSPFSHGMEIQNVIAHGFAGPRYFPAVQPR